MEVEIYKHEEKLNTISHALGVVLGIIGGVILLNSKTNSTPYATISIVVYSLAIILLFLASTLYHWVNEPKLKEKLRILDHSSIYVLIAGTYTPVTLITLVNGSGWTIFYIVWGIAITGIILKLFYTGKFEFISLLFYVIMGWLIIVDFNNLIDYISPTGIKLLLLGGILYTAGIIFYAVPKIPYNHFIWHLFVLGGAISHWLFMVYDVI